MSYEVGREPKSCILLKKKNICSTTFAVGMIAWLDSMCRLTYMHANLQGFSEGQEMAVFYAKCLFSPQCCHVFCSYVWCLI